MKLVLLGAVAMLSAPLFLQGGFSVPFVQYIGNPESHAALNPGDLQAADPEARNLNSGAGDPVGQIARANAPETTSRSTTRALPTGREARVTPAPQPLARQARLIRDDTAIDPRRLGRTPSASVQDAIVDPARFAAEIEPASDSDEALTVARLREIAGSARDAGNGRRMAALLGPASDLPHPTRRPTHEAAPQAESAKEIASLLETLPSGRPESSTAQVGQVQVASIGAEPGTEAALAAAADPDGVMLPDSMPVPGFRPERAVAPRPEPQAPTQATRAPSQNAPAPSSSVPQRTRGGALAYAPADGATDRSSGSRGGLLGRIFGNGGNHAGLPAASERIAVYDISAATVYMPNGDKLEAHSGLGHMQDNPSYTNRKNKGPTPANVYNLQMRKHLFHGVEAVRLLPADGKKKFNRDGFLAHTYMYRGGLSQSNGCVVFKNYERFLTAFKRGKVTRMIVVPRLAELPTYMASL